MSGQLSPLHAPFPLRDLPLRAPLHGLSPTPAHRSAPLRSAPPDFRVAPLRFPLRSHAVAAGESEPWNCHHLCFHRRAQADPCSYLLTFLVSLKNKHGGNNRVCVFTFGMKYIYLFYDINTISDNIVHLNVILNILANKPNIFAAVQA